MNKYIELVKKNKNKYVIFHRIDCFFCKEAIKLLKKKGIKNIRYKIDNKKGPKYYIKQLGQDDTLKTDVNHKTVPIIFKHGKFLGGYDELKKDLSDQV